MAEAFSPTGYWAVYLLDDDFVAAVSARAGRRAETVEVYPVVTWTTDGEAAIFDPRGKLTPASRRYPPESARFYVTGTHPKGEK